MEPASLLELLREAAKRGGDAALEALESGTAGKVVGIGEGGDYSLEGDVLSERAIIEYLVDKLGGLRVVSEEMGERVFGENPHYTAIIDPIDGSRNYKRGLPFFAVSVALAEGTTLDDVEAAVVYAPLLKFEFTALKGQGAFLNGRRVTVTHREELEGSLIFVSATPKATFLPQLFSLGVTLRGGVVRSLGSASLELSFVATGGADAYVDYWGTMRVIDIAAALLAAREAGAWVSVRGKLNKSGLLSLRERLLIIAASTERLGKGVEETLREVLGTLPEEVLAGG